MDQLVERAFCLVVDREVAIMQKVKEGEDSTIQRHQLARALRSLQHILNARKHIVTVHGWKGETT